MIERKQAVRAFRFGIFELDLRSRELRRRGLRVKLQEKPFQILNLLLEKAGELVSRKDLREKLWPDTFVGFDRSLNTAVNSLRRALGDSPGNPRFVETRARAGYRFVAPVEIMAESLDRSPAETDLTHSIAVLPFHNASGDPEMEYLSDGISDALINTLCQLPEVRVMARSSVFRYKGRELDPQAVGNELNVRTLLTGRVALRGRTLTIDAELVDAAKGWRLWGEQYHRKREDFLAIQEEISREITRKLHLHLTTEARRRLEKRYTENPEAYQNYLRGRYHWSKLTEEGLHKGIRFFERAIEQDPNFALPYAGISDCYGLFAFFGTHPSKSVMPKAERAARKAIEIDDSLADAHASLAGILKFYYWDWAGAEAEYKRALELSPGHATAHRWYADFLSALGRTDEAIKEMERAVGLDPLSLIINAEIAWIAYMAHDASRAVDQSLKTLEIEPHFLPACHILGLAYEQMGRNEEAIKAFEKASQGSSGNPIGLAALGHAHAVGGHKREARAILSDLKRQSKTRYVPPYGFAMVNAGLGDRPETLRWLQIAYEERDVWLIWLQRDPRLIPISQEPFFQRLLRNMGFPNPQSNLRAMNQPPPMIRAGRAPRQPACD